MKCFIALVFGLILFFSTQAQVNYTANDQVPAYNSSFGFGVNPGGHANWRDEQLADIAIGSTELNIPGVGVNALRPALPEKFLEEWGYHIRIDAFQDYARRGATDNVIFIGYPSEAHRSTEQHCPGQRSEIFKNIYQKIWDGGSRGTPYNDNNHYAAYVYEMVNRYKDYVRFYEVWNEPDFPTVNYSVQRRDEPRNWWDNDPDPCSVAIKAPIYHYNRMLRITYEIVKTLDPDSYVAVGGLGKTAFLDAILRNTDNPNQGKVNADYPLYGGAYFDVLSFHSYPHIDGSLQEWNNARGAFDYARHSDAAVDGFLNLRDEFEEVLFNHGYDGNDFPEKKWIVTETNVPRKSINNRMGSVAAQINYVIKTMVEAQRVDIKQVHLYKLGDTDNFHSAQSEFALMGMYNNLSQNPPYRQKVNDLGIAYKTTSDALIDKTYDAAAIEALNLPAGTRGGAFVDDNGEYTYVLWAITNIDNTENAEATLDLSTVLGTSDLLARNWEYARSEEDLMVNPSTLKLTGSPLFIFTSENPNVPSGEEPVILPNIFSASPNPFINELVIGARLNGQSAVAIDIVNRFGQLVETVVEETLEAGEYQYTLDTSSWAAGMFFMQVRQGGVGDIPIWIQIIKVPF